MTEQSTEAKKFRQLSELVKLVCDVEANWLSKGFHICWFRGSNTAHDLVPGQYHSRYRTQFAETSTFYEFQVKARGFLQKYLSDWELFFLMQHYRIPTRLLDWTENCFVALYFALTDSTAGGYPCIWILNPLLFNEKISPNKRAPIVITPESTDPKFNYWINVFHPVNFDSTETTFTDEKGHSGSIENPVAMYPPTIDPRIIAQRSVFTLHGCRREPIDKCCEGLQNPKSDFIRQFIFKGIKKEVLRELRCFGMTREAIFPDLEGLGLELRKKLML